MKRLVFLVVLVLCVITGGVLWLVSDSTPSPRVIAAFRGFTNGVPNWTVDSWFIKMSPQRAQLMQEWFNAGTNAARFGIANTTRHAIRVDAIARLEGEGWNEDTPVLSARNFRGVYIGPSETGIVQVAKLPHNGKWRIRFSYVRDDGKGHALAYATREVGALIKGGPSPSRVPDEFRDSIGFSSDWIEQ
jgi:hypothetical protein